MKKLSIFLTFIIFCNLLQSCKKEKIDFLPTEKTFAEIFYSLPEQIEPTHSDMTIETVVPGNGPNYIVLKYKGTNLNQSNKWWVRIISQDFAFGSANWGTVYFAHKYKLLTGMPGNLLFTPELGNVADLRHYRIKIDETNEYAYLRAELWTMADIERSWAGLPFIGEKLYFRYSLLKDELVDENLQKINLYVLH